MNSRYRGSYSEPKSLFNGALTWLTLLGFGGLVLLAMFGLFSGSRKAPSIVVDTSNLGAGFNAQVAGNTTNPSTGTILTFPAISQRDKSQYSSEAEWREWAASACSAAAMTSVLNGFGKQVKISDVLVLMRGQNSITSSGGLYRYGVFSSIGSQYGLKVQYSEDKDVDRHFNAIMGALGKGSPVIVNIQDATFFPNGHFIVAVRANPDGTVSVINPDPALGKPVNQDWPRDTLKTYFSRSLRSAIFTS